MTTTTQNVPAHEIQGYAPGGIPAFSNFENNNFPENRDLQGFFTGVKWQCVEFARRWLLHRKGLMLPDVYFAAHLFLIPHVFDAATFNPVPVRSVRNGAPEPPQADSLIIYSTQYNSFPGHVGVITEVGKDYVRVADQNRFFHKWEGEFSHEFPLEKDTKGNYHIIDKHETVLGWVLFPAEYKNRSEAEKDTIVIKEGATKPPGFDSAAHKKFFRSGFGEVRTLMKIPYILKFIRVTFMFMVVFPLLQWFKNKFFKGKGNNFYPSSPKTSEADKKSN